MTGIDQLFRNIRKPIYIIIAITGVCTIIDIPSYFNIALFTEQYLGIYLTLILLGTFISIPASKGKSFGTFDLVISIIALPVGFFITVYYPAISLTLGAASLNRTILGTLAILLIIEALRRSMGVSLTIIVSIFLIYTKFASYLPGIFHGRFFTLTKMVNYIYLDPNSLLYMLTFGATVGVAFIFFGQILLHYGGGKTFIDFALLLTGKSKGGSAKTAVVSSSLVGTITGAPMSNVLLTGSVTIPMMKEAGYKPKIAAAVESVASSGGQIMPPVMGIAAFIMAETLGIPYLEVAIAAIIPALLFYFAIFIQIHMEANKYNLKKIDPKQLVKPKRVLKDGWYIIPSIIILLIFLFFLAFPPAISAVVSGLSALPFLALKSEYRKGFFKRLFEALEESGKLIVNIGVVMAAAGLIVGSINASGLAFNLSMSLTSLGEGNVFLLLIAAAISALILGMGMPSVAAYALVSILVAPSLVDFGILPMAAHLFVFYFAVISNITPPVAVSCFAAAPLAGANPTETGFAAFKLGIAAYIAPFIFCFNPALILVGTPIKIITSIFFVSAGIFALSVALAGYFTDYIPMSKRVIIIAICIPIFLPTHFLINIIGIIALFFVLFPYMKNSIESKRQGNAFAK